jgi:hypothetical protein
MGAVLYARLSRACPVRGTRQGERQQAPEREGPIPFLPRSYRCVYWLFLAARLGLSGKNRIGRACGDEIDQSIRSSTEPLASRSGGEMAQANDIRSIRAERKGRL